MTRGIFVGLSTIDIVYNVDEFPAPNAKVAARSQSIFVGGPATNAAIAFAHFGGQATLVTAVGRHPMSQTVRQELEKYSVQLIDLNPDFDEAPAISSVAVDRAGRRNVVSANAARFITPVAEVDRKLCERASIVLVDGHFMQACHAWASAAQANGVPVVLDGGSWKDGTEELLKNVQTAICSADFLPPGCTIERRCDAIPERPPRGEHRDHGWSRARSLRLRPIFGNLACPRGRSRRHDGRWRYLSRGVLPFRLNRRRFR